MACENRKNIIIRPAKEDDYAGVMDISKGIHGGRDVVPAQFFEYIANPNKHPWVAVRNGKVVGFKMFYSVGDGYTIIGEALRRDTSLKGAKVMNMLDDYMYPVMLEKYPKLVLERCVSIHTDYWENRSRTVEGTKIPLTRTIIQIAWDEDVENIRRAIIPNQIARLSLQLPIDRVIEATNQDVEHIFQNQVFRSSLFPDGIVVRANEPFDVMLKSTPSTVLAGCKNVYMTKTKSGVYESISFGVVIECPAGTQYLFDYYGTEDCNVILAHLVKHLIEVPNYFSGFKMMMDFFLPTKLLNANTTNKIDDFIAGSLQLNTGNVPMLKQHVVEYPIPPQYKAKL